MRVPLIGRPKEITPDPKILTKNLEVSKADLIPFYADQLRAMILAAIADGKMTILEALEIAQKLLQAIMSIAFGQKK